MRVLELLGAALPSRALAERERWARHVVSAIAVLLVTRGRVAVPGLGVFVVKTRKARRITNPQTGEAMTLPEGIEVRFRAAKALKAELRSTGWAGRSP
jgi:DNA-binding protein HU-beta